MPGTHGAGRSSAPRWRRAVSVGLTAAALTAILTSPSRGSRTGSSATLTTSGPPGSVITTARMAKTSKNKIINKLIHDAGGEL
jgi:hypothetical protein